MEATPTSSITSLDDTTHEYYVKEEPLDSGTPLFDVVAAATSLNDDDTTQEYVFQETLESRTPLVDGGEHGGEVKLSEDDEDVRATMAKALPKYIIIQSNQNIRYLHNDEKNPTLPNALRFAGDYSFGLETGFELVQATTGNGLVHIRSLHNNKYLAYSDPPKVWITATGDKPEEDQSKTNCTLFRPFILYSNNNRVVKLQHVNTRGYLWLYRHSGHDMDGALHLQFIVGTDSDSFTFIDRESVTVLPDLIRIKGNNGRHLCAWADGFMDYQFEADNSSLFDYEVSPSRNGGIRLKSTHFGTYWTDMDNSTWVLLRQASTTVHNTNTVFLPVIRSGGRVIMRSLKSNRFCNRHTGEGKRDCLATLNTFPDDWSYMDIEEPVYSRTINNVRYRLTDAMIYNEGAPWIAFDNTNNRSELPQESQLDIRRTVTNTTKWSNSFSLKVGFKITFQRGVLDVSSNGIELSAEVTKETDWEETETESLELGSLRTVTIPPTARVEARLIGTRISYDIPFSYTQRDVLKNGTIKVYQKNDGLLNGTNGYDYKQDILQLPLPPL